MFLLYALFLSLSCAGAQEHAVNDANYEGLIGDIAVLKYQHDLQQNELRELRAKMQTQEKRIQDLEEQVRLDLPKCIDNISAVQEKFETQDKRIQHLEISQGQVQLDLKKCIDDVKSVSIDGVQENTAVQEQILNHENNLGWLMTVFRSMKITIAGIQKALYHQKLLTQQYDSRENKNALTRLTKLETQFKKAPKGQYHNYVTRAT